MKLPFLLGSPLKLLRGPHRDQEGADLLSSPEAFSGNVLTRSQDPGVLVSAGDAASVDGVSEQEVLCPY